jgi:hypothetical protein
MINYKKFPIVVGIILLVGFAGCQKESKSNMANSSNAVSSNNQLYIDIHRNVKGLTTEAVAEAHKKDLAIQEKYDVRYIKYWYNPSDGSVFCLSEAPSKRAVEAVHREAHGMVADEIIAVKEGH